MWYWLNFLKVTGGFWYLRIPLGCYLLLFPEFLPGLPQRTLTHYVLLVQLITKLFTGLSLWPVWVFYFIKPYKFEKAFVTLCSFPHFIVFVTQLRETMNTSRILLYVCCQRVVPCNWHIVLDYTAQIIKLSVKDFFGKYETMHTLLIAICSLGLKKSSTKILSFV